jgi:hypothetical protein
MRTKLPVPFLAEDEYSLKRLSLLFKLRGKLGEESRLTSVIATVPIARLQGILYVCSFFR